MRLRATLEAIDNRKYQCSECLSQFSNRTDAEEMLAKVKDQQGCTDEKHYTVLDADGLQFKKCPGNFYDRGALSWVRVHSFYEKGVMPYTGPFLEWPAKAVEILGVISSYRTTQAHKMEMQRAAKQRAEQHARSARGRR